eukprot:765655-Pyramimonas_sp.AAC.1
MGGGGGGAHVRPLGGAGVPSSAVGSGDGVPLVAAVTGGHLASVQGDPALPHLALHLSPHMFR